MNSIDSVDSIEFYSEKLPAVQQYYNYLGVKLF